jgi:hypothetical protein
MMFYEIRIEKHGIPFLMERVTEKTPEEIKALVQQYRADYPPVKCFRVVCNRFDKYVTNTGY